MDEALTLFAYLIRYLPSGQEWLILVFVVLVASAAAVTGTATRVAMWLQDAYTRGMAPPTEAPIDG